MNRHRNSIAMSLIALSALIAAFSGFVDEAGFAYTEQTLRRALLTFAIARGLNGVISVAQGTGVAVAPAGIGMNFTPGQILDPVNDLIEQFSWVMLASATSLGVQRLLLEVFATRGFTLLLAGVVVLWLALLWRPRLATPEIALLARRLALTLLVLRFAIPALALTSELLYSGFLADRYEASTARIESATLRIDAIPAAPASNEQHSFAERAQRWLESAKNSIDMESHINRYRDAAADVSEQMVNLTVVFLVQTVLLPLLFLWSLIRGLRWLLRPEQVTGVPTPLSQHAHPVEAPSHAPD